MLSKNAERVQRRRDALRASGLRPVQIWVPDTRRAGFAEECQRQSALLRDDAHERDVLQWIEDSADTADWR
ncbi:antitoxin MazE family protein [Polycyclovorans algicola]|uniref:antitoxin MazE family protein n=1 Tax=Polycyclovorans algicola TaxID=616992 RepID=UPI0004A6D67D|nr:antitoxin MazE family protein [Polycyclovorans algicola]